MHRIAIIALMGGVGGGSGRIFFGIFGIFFGFFGFFSRSALFFPALGSPRKRSGKPSRMQHPKIGVAGASTAGAARANMGTAVVCQQPLFTFGSSETTRSPLAIPEPEGEAKRSRGQC